MGLLISEALTGNIWIPSYYMNALEDTILVSGKDLQGSEVVHGLMKNSTQLEDPHVRFGQRTARHCAEYRQKCPGQQAVYAAHGKRVKMS